MKYTLETIIDLPRPRVIELFDSIENMYKWQPTLQRHEFVDGTPGEEGARMKLFYKEGKRDIELLETITKKDLPREFNGTYETKGVYNEIQNLFEEVEGGKTRWISVQQFHLSGFLKVIGWLMPGAFKKQSKKMHDRFKAFAESQK